MMRKRDALRVVYLLVVFTALFVVTMGCAKGDDKGVCQNGAQITCDCGGGVIGSQACANGMFTTCQCGAAGAGATGTATTTSGSTAGPGTTQTNPGTGAGGSIATTSTSTGAPTGGSTGTATATGSAGSATGSAGSGASGRPTCPSTMKCTNNSLLDGILGGMAGGGSLKFCAPADDTQSQMGGAVGPTPPACNTADDCTTLGLSGQCMDTGIMGIKGCLVLCQ